MFYTHYISLLCFFGTNLLTRCRRASCCFLLFLVSEILVRNYSWNRTKSTPKVLEIREASRAPEKGQRGARGPHTLGRRGPSLGRAGLVCGSTRTPPTLPFRLLKVSVAKTLPRWTKPEKTFQSRRHREAKIWGTGSLFRHPAGAGKCPRKASPSTPLPSPPPSSSPLLLHDGEGVIHPRG